MTWDDIKAAWLEKHAKTGHGLYEVAYTENDMHEALDELRAMILDAQK